jgi:[acyl-carrier-protein] S-malonyltransferase
MNVIMFSGQGSQKVGMGKFYYDNFTVSRRVFEEASDLLSFDMAKLCFKDETGVLGQTEFAQPALLTAGIAAFRALSDEGLNAGLLMGLSLGEYTALVAAEILDFAGAVVLVHKRGLIMKQFAPPGGMLAVVGLDKIHLEEICKMAAPHGFAACANFNAATQIVISGEAAALDFCAAEVKKSGGKAIKLKVSGPFHTPLMAEASERFRQEMTELQIKSATTGVLPVISNVSADVLNSDDLKDLPAYLARHMTSPVLWADSIAKAKVLGGTVFRELGSGNTLERLVI